MCNIQTSSSVMKFRENPESGDPSSIQQSFERMELNVHCCRYWWLRRWRHQRLSYPYWRLYWNKTAGASVYFEQNISLDPDRIILIPPHTPFSTDISGDQSEDQAEYCLEGGWINTTKKEEEALQMGHIPHLFIHFNLGYSFDNIKPAIYHFMAERDLLDSIDRITGLLKEGVRNFEFGASLEIYNLISSLVGLVPGDAWGESPVGSGTLEVMNYIQRHLNENMDNEKLAGMVHMAPNSFARLFKQQSGLTPQTFIRKARIENACRLLHHTNLTISSIADQCGFSDRYYFTKVFTELTDVSPALYRRKFQLGKD